MCGSLGLPVVITNYKSKWRQLQQTANQNGANYSKPQIKMAPICGSPAIDVVFVQDQVSRDAAVFGLELDLAINFKEPGLWVAAKKKKKTRCHYTVAFHSRLVVTSENE